MTLQEFSIVIQDVTIEENFNGKYRNWIYHTSSTGVTEKFYHKLATFRHGGMRLTVYYHKHISIVPDIEAGKHVSGVVYDIITEGRVRVERYFR